MKTVSGASRIANVLVTFEPSIRLHDTKITKRFLKTTCLNKGMKLYFWTLQKSYMGFLLFWKFCLVSFWQICMESILWIDFWFLLMFILCLAMYKRFPTEPGRGCLRSNSSGMRNRQTSDNWENEYASVDTDSSQKITSVYMTSLVVYL